MHMSFRFDCLLPLTLVIAQYGFISIRNLLLQIYECISVFCISPEYLWAKMLTVLTARSHAKTTPRHYIANLERQRVANIQRRNTIELKKKIPFCIRQCIIKIQESDNTYRIKCCVHITNNSSWRCTDIINPK